MKSVMSRLVLGRRVAATAAVGLVATTLSLGIAGTASAGPGIELQGTVTGAGGVALAGADVTAYDAGTGNSIETVVTDAVGHYAFTDDLVVGQIKVKFQAADPTLTLTSVLPYQVRWSGGSRYIEGASITTIASADPATPGTVNASLPQYAAINGNVVAADTGQPAANWTDWVVYDSDENNWMAYNQDVSVSDPWYDTYWDNATGNFRLVVDPSTPLRIAAYGQGATVSYLTQYWKDADTVASATPITVSPGQTATGINFRLTNALTVRQAPKILGYPTVGKPLAADPGLWSRNAGTEFSYVWKRGTAIVGTASTYTPTLADIGQKLTLAVTALHGQYTGQSVATTSDVVRYAATVRGTAKALAGFKARFAIKMVSAKQSPVRGKVVVLRGSKVVHKAVKLVKGKAVILVKGQPKGKQMFTVRYLGNKKLSKVDRTFTVRIHR